MVASVTAYHVADFHLLPPRQQVPGHLVGGVLAVAAAAATGVGVDDLGLAPSRLGRGLAVGLVAGAVAGGVLAVAGRSRRARRAFTDVRARELTRAQLRRRVAIDIPLGTAVYEELVFRSALMGILLRRHTPLTALLLSSAAFGLWHVQPALVTREDNAAVAGLPPAGAVIGAVTSTTVAGLGFGWLRLAGASVLAPIVAHTATNAGALVASWVVQRPSPPDAECDAGT